MTSSGGETYMRYSPPPPPRPPTHISGVRSAAAALFEKERYLSELLAEEQKLNPFMPVLHHSYRLLREEIMRVTRLLENASVLGQSGLEHAGPMASGGAFLNAGADMHRWRSQLQSGPAAAQNWSVSQGSSSRLSIKRIKLDIPVDQYPNYNFAERILGPLGNSIKRIEEITGCRVLVRGHGSTNDPAMEEMMRGQPGFKHLNEPLHVIIEAELPVEIIDTQLVQAHKILQDLIKPADESPDMNKRPQFRELAVLDGTLPKAGSPMSGSVSPFRNSFGMKRAKTGG